jgi:tricorn protease interacting factor F2/3
MPDQLSAAVRPQHYNVHYSIDFTTFTFKGTVETSLNVTETQAVLRLHCEALTIHTCAVTCNNTECPLSPTLSDNELHLIGKQPFVPGTYLLHISFSGALTDDLSGLYRSSFTDASGAAVYLATTQFEAPYARKALPCFDEPQFKATFAVSMEIPAAMTGISNMPAVSEQITGNRKTITFATTPPMATYLLYLGAGRFDYIEEKRGNRTVRVYGVNGKSRQGAFALTLAADTLDFFEQYTGVPYPLPKLDLIAIPDFAAGAMENWGAVTFREVLLYADEQETSLSAKKRIAEVVAHELWHQWSGNLVTMQWWDDLWLNEAFATYIAYHAVDHFFPEWNIRDDFTGSETARAFDMDMLSSTHPVAVTVETPNQIEEIFDGISYGKGGSILCMLEHYIGEEAFRIGVSAYLKAFAYKNATARDLWDTLEKYSGKPVKEMLVQWITRPGFPLLSVTSSRGKYLLRQQRFSAGTPDTDAPWPIPLTWYDGNGSKTHMMDTRELEIEASTSVIKFNCRQTGFYRTLYQTDMYPRFHDALLQKKFTAHDRWGLINDLWAGVLAGYAGLPVLLNLMDACVNEDRLFVLEEMYALCNLTALHLHLPDGGKDLYLRYKRPFAAQLEKLGWQPLPSDTPEEKQLRSLAIGFLIAAGDATVCNAALSRAEAYMAGEAVDPDIRNVCLDAVAATNDDAQFAAAKNVYESKTGAEEKLALLGTLAGFKNGRLLESFLDYSLTDAVRRQNLRGVFSRVAKNPCASGLFFAWSRSNREKLFALSESYFVFMGFLQTLIATAPDKAVLVEIRNFLEKHTTGFEKTKANAFETAALYLRFREREQGCFG